MKQRAVLKGSTLLDIIDFLKNPPPISEQILPSAEIQTDGWAPVLMSPISVLCHNGTTEDPLCTSSDFPLQTNQPITTYNASTI